MEKLFEISIWVEQMPVNVFGSTSGNTEKKLKNPYLYKKYTWN